MLVVSEFSFSCFNQERKKEQMGRMRRMNCFFFSSLNLLVFSFSEQIGMSVTPNSFNEMVVFIDTLLNILLHRYLSCDRHFSSTNWFNQ